MLNGDSPGPIPVNRWSSCCTTSSAGAGSRQPSQRRLIELEHIKISSAVFEEDLSIMDSQSTG